MKARSFATGMLILAGCLPLAACGSNTSSSETAAAPEASASAAAATAFPASLRVVGDGYPASGDPCRRLGESDATVDWLDDSADLVGCPTKEDARALGGRMVGVIDGITLVSVPMGKANAGLAPSAAMAPPVKPAAAKDIIRGKGGLEAKCLAAVAKQGTTVIGTNRIEESEAAIAIYVNVQGGQAPWRCLGYKDGSIGEVMYTGDEGAL
jgi:hypothetical protein